MIETNKPKCENCGVEGALLRRYANLDLCPPCFDETHSLLTERVPPTRTNILWLAIDLEKLKTYGLAADSGEWLGKFVLAAMQSPSAVELNNLASLFEAARGAAFDAYQRTAAGHRPAPGPSAPLPSPKGSKQKSWDEMLAEI